MLGFADLISARGRMRCNLMVLDEARLIPLPSPLETWHSLDPRHSTPRNISLCSCLFTSDCQGMSIIKGQKTVS